MHETSIAQSLIASVAGMVPAGGRVFRIQVRLGALSGADDEELVAAFHRVCAGTIADGARLGIELVPVRLWCTRCHAIVESMPRIMRCRRCRTPGEVMINGRELEVAWVELDGVGRSDLVSS